jgi:hypothetical protein
LVIAAHPTTGKSTLLGWLLAEGVKAVDTDNLIKKYDSTFFSDKVHLTHDPIERYDKVMAEMARQIREYSHDHVVVTNLWRPVLVALGGNAPVFFFRSMEDIQKEWKLRSPKASIPEWMTKKWTPPKGFRSILRIPTGSYLSSYIDKQGLVAEWKRRHGSDKTEGVDR